MWQQKIETLKSAGFNIVARTHTGHALQKNEDRFFIKTLKDKSILCAVADGLSGESKGDFASELVINNLSGIDEFSYTDFTRELSDIALRIDRLIHKKSERSSNLSGTGSTMVGILLKNSHAYWVHVGDSRLYLFRDNSLIQLTEDQTRARFLLKEGEITAKQYPIHHSRQIMDQYLGCGFCEPETGSFILKPKDIIIISTDGLHKSIDDDAILSAIRTSGDIDAIVRSLENSALQNGGEDNITVIGIEVSDHS